MIKYLFITASMGLLVQASAQQSGTSINGMLQDPSHEPVPFAAIFLKSSSDSSLFKGEISDEAGSFRFENIPPGGFYIELQMTGFEKLQKSITVTGEGPVELGTLQAIPSSHALSAVTVTADKPFIERQVDRTVVNIENSLIQVNSSILEVMEKLPGVQVDQDGRISLKGKQAVIIMIDGKPSALGGQELANMLRGMSSSGIQKVEIITNPSAKYDAAGNAGIINIVMKKNRLEGFNGNISAGYGQGRYAKYNSSLSLNYKKSSYNLFFYYSYSNRKGFNNLMLNRKFYSGDTLQTVFDTDNYIIFPFSTHAPRIGADIYLSGKTTLSFLGTGVVNAFNPSAKNHTDILDGQNNKISSYDFINDSHDNWYNYTGNVQLKHQFDSIGQEITFDLDYARYWNKTDQLFTTTTRNNKDSITGIDHLAGKQNGELYLYSFKADYSKPLRNMSRFEAGLKSSYVTSDKNMQFYDRVNNIDSFDTARSSHFLYSENINAAYLNFNRELKKLTVQLGLRTEHTAAKGKQLLDGQTFDRNYIQVFPTLFLDYKLNKDHGLNLSLGRRIDRPGYDQMNPFRRLIDATTYSEGNPYLNPQLTYNTELSWTYKQSLFVTAGYSLTMDNITDVLIQDAASKTTIQAIVNLNELNYYSLNITWSKKLSKWWTTNTSFLGYYGVYSGAINNFNIDQGTPSFTASTSNTFPITEGFSAELGFQYNHRNLYGVTTMQSNSNLSLGLQKSLFKKKGSLTLNVNDMLWMAYPSGITRFGYVNEDWTSRRDTRVVNLSFSYKFGRGPGARMRRKTGADDEKSRISNG